MKKKYIMFTYAFIALFGAFVDILTKHHVFNYLKVIIDRPDVKIPPFYRAVPPGLFIPMNYKPITVIPNFFDITVCLNRGAVWGSFQGYTIMLSLFSIIAIIFLIYLVIKKSDSFIYQINLGLITAGALGNLWDRIIFGGVRDFLDFYIGKWHWPTFNIADAFIVIGIINFIILDIIDSKKKEKIS